MQGRSPLRFSRCEKSEIAISGEQLRPGDRPKPRSIRPGVQLLEQAELLDDRQRRVIRKHYATGELKETLSVS